MVYGTTIPTTVPIYDDSGKRIGEKHLDNFNVDVRITAPLFGDVNSDGVVNILDLVRVAASFGKTVQRLLVDGQLFAVGDDGILLPAGRDPADVNEDGVVNIIDLVQVAGALGVGAAAPSAYPRAQAMLNTVDVQRWLSEAQQLKLTDATSQRGIRFLAQLLANFDAQRNSLVAQLPKPLQPGDLDTVSVV